MPRIPDRDPVEEIVADVLTLAGISFIRDASLPSGGRRVDFYLDGLDTYIECKRYYTSRITEQMNQVENMIVIQGLHAANVFAFMIKQGVNR